MITYQIAVTASAIIGIISTGLFLASVMVYFDWMDPESRDDYGRRPVIWWWLVPLALIAWIVYGLAQVAIS